MKRLLITIFILFNFSIAIGCDSNKSSLSEDQKIAIENSIKYINKSSFSNKNRINTRIIEIKNVTEDYLRAVSNIESRVEENKVDLTDWIITIGNTTGHDFAFIVCDSSTYEVIGYIPID